MSELLNISDASSIAIHSLVLIANSEEMLNAKMISQTLGFSKNHTAKVLQLLARHNYLVSLRGPKGGFKLKVAPKQISFLEIFELVEGKVGTGNCLHGAEKCPLNVCIYGNFGIRFTRQFKEYFGKRKLSDIVIKLKTKPNRKNIR